MFYMLILCFLCLVLVASFQVVKNQRLEKVYRLSYTRANENAKTKKIFAIFLAFSQTNLEIEYHQN